MPGMKKTISNSGSISSSIVYIIMAVIIVGGLALTALVVARQSPKQSSGRIKVVAAENFWGNIASQIGGDSVEVTSILSDPSADPHLYESNANNAAAVSGADVVIENGLGYDDFMDKLLAGSNKSGRVVVSAAKEYGASDGANPHLWYDTPKVKLMAGAIEKAIADKDPVHKAEYERNLGKFNDGLQPVLDKISQINTQFPGAPVAYTEPVPGYMLANAGLSVKTPEGFAAAIEEGNEPSPADAATMAGLMTGKQVRVLLYNSQATSAVTQHIQDLAKAAGVPVVPVTETMPPGAKDFQSWQLEQVTALYNALNGQ